MRQKLLQTLHIKFEPCIITIFERQIISNIITKLLFENELPCHFLSRTLGEFKQHIGSYIHVFRISV